MSKQGHPWDEQENDKLRAAVSAGMKTDEIAEALGRTRAAINSRAYDLEIGHQLRQNDNPGKLIKKVNRFLVPDEVRDDIALLLDAYDALEERVNQLEALVTQIALIIAPADPLDNLRERYGRS